jgi:N4-gp56 family major capsid protein
MADSVVASGLTVQQWDDKFFTEYLTENRYAGEFGTDESSIIQVKEDLTKKKGDRVHFALVNKLTQNAITGSNVLEGNEERMDTRSFAVTVDKRRNGVRVAEIDEQYSAIGLREAARAVLKDWSMKDTEKLIEQALASINGVALLTSTEAQRDAWLVDNVDRIYDPSGTYGTDHSAIWDALDGSNDILTAADLSAMKLRAMTIANPKIRPVRSEANGRHYYVAYVHPLAFRDLKTETSSPIVAAQREVMLEMENNRLFKGGDLLWDGIIIKEASGLYDTTTLTGEGASGTTTVVPVYLCGAQAIGVAYANRWRTRDQEFDYGDKKGVAIDSIYGVAKMQFGSGTADTDDLKDHGVLTGWFASSTTA